MRRFTIFATLVLLIASTGSAQLAPSPYFKVVDLGPVGISGMPNSLNDHRDVAGTAQILRNGANRLTPVFWTNGTNMQQLGPADSTGGEAFKVNQAGHIVGYYVKNNGLNRRTAFYFDGSVHELPSVLSDDHALASDLNDSDVIVGSSYGSPSGGGGYGNGVPVRWSADDLTKVKQIDQNFAPPLVGLAWYSLARSRWLNGTKIYINNQGTVAARWEYSGWSNVYPQQWDHAYNYYPDSYPVLYNPTTNMWNEFNWPGIGDCFPPNNTFAKSWDYMQPQAISDEKQYADGGFAGAAKVIGTGDRCTYYTNATGGYVQDNIAFITDANSTDNTYQEVFPNPDGTNLTKTINPHSFSNWIIVPGTPVCVGSGNVRSSYSFFGVRRILDSNGNDQLAVVGAHSVVVNCSLATGGSTERAVARYYARDGYDGNTTVELNTRVRSDCGWTLGRATAINSAGEILGKGLKSGITGPAAYRAFLLVPTDTLPPTKEEGCLDAPPGDETPANGSPLADAGLDQRVEATSSKGAVAALDGSGSSDPDGDPLTYSWSWSGGSASGVAPQVQLPIGVTTITLTVSDGKGGTDSDDVVITVQDTQAPTIVCGNPDGNWHAQDVTITCTASDPTSGLAHAEDSNFTLYTSVPVGSEYSNAATNSHELCDNQGNCATAGPIAGNMIDRKPPQVNCGTADGNWHAVDVTISCTAEDAGSGLANPTDANLGLSTSVTANTETADALTGSRNVCDKVGNCSAAGPISANKIDKKAPSITISSPIGAYLLLQSNVTASYSCDDAGSGPASCSGPVANGATLALSNAGSFNFTVTATDAAGNTATLSKPYSVGYNICDGEIPGSVNSGRTIPIRVKVCSANGNASSADLVLTATSVMQISTNVTAPLEDAGNANPDMNFRYTSDSAGYLFNLQTTGFPTGTFLLNFKAGADPSTHSVAFQVR